MFERAGVAITSEVQRILGTVRDIAEGVKGEEALFQLGFREDAVLAALEDFPTCRRVSDDGARSATQA